jgi:hypothetical protein
MLRLAPAAAFLAVPLLAFASGPRAEGRIETEDGRIEILNEPVRVGEKIQLPEGFLIVEEKGTEDEQIGSFGVVSSEEFMALAAPSAAPEARPEVPVPPSEVAPQCRAERAAYLAELWKQSGVDVPDPLALLEGLESGASGPKTGYYWFALATDAFRPLAYNSDLRNRADALVRCMHGR